MQTGVVVKWSVVLAVLVAVLSVAVAGSGLHKSPLAGGLVSIAVAIVLNLFAIFMALRETAPQNTYGRQLLVGLMIGLVGGVLIYLSSWLMLSTVFPNYLDEMREGYAEFMRASGLPADQVDAQIRQMEGTTPASQSVAGLIGTFFTSLIAAAIIGIVVRKK